MLFPKNYYDLYKDLLYLEKLKNQSKSQKTGTRLDSDNQTFEKIIKSEELSLPTSDFERTREDVNQKKSSESVIVREIEDNSPDHLNRELHKNIKDHQKTISYKKFMQIERNVNNSILKNVINDPHNVVNLQNQEQLPQVFLSYPVKDLLLAIMLFYYLYYRGIYLYVDYMHNSRLNNLQLKMVLKQELDISNQLLLIDGRNNRITLDSKTYIRPWCAWEIGLYFENNRHNMFKLGWADSRGNGQQVKMINDLREIRDVVECKSKPNYLTD